MTHKSTLFEKLWRQHTVAELNADMSLLHIDRVFLHERTGSVALQSLEDDSRRVRHPELAFCTMDHIVDTLPGRSDKPLMPGGQEFIQTTRETTRRAGIKLYDVNDPNQGIVHVISPEQGIVLPGTTVVCPDSHTCTQGALGALAWGIGSSEAEHALATQTLRVTKPRSMRVRFEGALSECVTSKDMMLWLIHQYSASGAAGHAVEFAGSTVRNLSIEARMTLCNMAVEFSAFTGLIAPDQAVFDYLHGRPFAPRDAIWNHALQHWATLYTDDGAHFDREIVVDSQAIGPMVTWGTSPQHAVSIDATIPDPGLETDTHSRTAMERALTYMDLQPGQSLASVPIDAAFIGSCTNSRLSDLQAAAHLLRGRRVAGGVRAICVPGSSQVKRAAEEQGLDKVFIDAGFEWREPGCSMCFFAGGESFGLRERVVSTTNRNFESRQGPQTRSHLASPLTVAASALAGHLSDPRNVARVANG